MVAKAEATDVAKAGVVDRETNIKRLKGFSE